MTKQSKTEVVEETVSVTEQVNQKLMDDKAKGLSNNPPMDLEADENLSAEQKLEILSKAFELAEAKAQADDTSQRTVGLIKSHVQNQFPLIGITSHTQLLPPKFEWLNDQGEWVKEVKNPQHLDVERLRIGNPECTATVQDALTVREMVFKAFGDKILELYNMTKEIRDCQPAIDRGAFSYCNAQRDKRLAVVYNAMKPSEPRAKKSNSQKVFDAITKVIEKVQASEDIAWKVTKDKKGNVIADDAKAYTDSLKAIQNAIVLGNDHNTQDKS
jgi:hypothetical protein